jgi:hypothetical protein
MLHRRRSRGVRRVVSAACTAAVGVVLACGSVPRSATQADAGQQKKDIPAEPPAPPTWAIHSISVAFNYDFTKTPACSATVTTNCVSKFQVFDISIAGKQFLLFSIAVPPGAAGKSNPIKAAGPRMKFEMGKHRLGVSAMTPQGGQSDPALCSTVVNVGPSTPGS